MKRYSKSISGSKARKQLLDGARKVHKAVSTTLGPRGRNVVLWKQHDTQVQHDGVTVANQINPKHPYKSAGAEIIKQAARRQVDVVGDGTTIAVVLGYGIASEALKIVESGVNPMALRAGLLRGKDLLVREINKLAKPIKTKKEKIQVATIASEDKDLGKLIGEILHKTGIDGVVSVEENTGSETFVDHQEGMQLDSGYKTHFFVTNPRSMTASVSRARVLVTDYKLDNIYELVPMLENVVDVNKERSIVIFAEDIEGGVLAALVQNKMQGKMNVLAVKAPTFHNKEILQDIATVVGAKLITQEAKMDLKAITIEDLGYAERITSTKDATVIAGGGGKKTAVKNRVVAIKQQLEEEDKEFDSVKLKERLAKLTGGVYVVNVGGDTEVEARERKERAIDAVMATKAAIEEGIVAGGEVVFLPIIDVLKTKDEDEEYAFRILRKALLKPFNKLVENAGMDAGEMRSKLKDDMGIDVISGEMVDMFDKGIVDPAKVATEAIKNGVSVAIAIITSDAIVAEIEIEDKK